MPITYRLTKGLPLTNAEIDANFQFIEDTFSDVNDNLGLKLDSADYNAADVLSKLLTVDGTGSGLDADTLDGKNTASDNTSNTVVIRDGSGNFSAGTITASLTGNVNAVTLTAASTGFTVAGGTSSKTLTVSNTLTLTGTDSSSVAFGSGGTVAYLSHKLSEFSATTSAELRTVITDETGTGGLVFANTPTLVTPILGVASATSINKVTITAPATSATLTIANGKTLTASNTLTLTGTDSSSVAFGTGGTVVYNTSLNQFSSNTTTATEFRALITDGTKTGTGSVVFGTSPTITTPTYATSSSTTDADTVINAATTDLATVIASFTATRTINVSNLTAGRKVTIYVRNTNGTARTINIAAGTATTYTAVNLSRSGAASVTSFSAVATSGTAVVTLFNVGGTIVGSLA